MTLDQENRSPVKLITKRFVLLWAAVCAGRLLYMLQPLAGVMIRPFLEFAFFVFLLTIAAIEIRILRMAAADFRNSSDPHHPNESSETSRSIPVYSLWSKLTMGIFIFCLVFVLWDTRSDNQMAPIMSGLGVAMNLWWVWRFATPSLRSNRP